ncbi:MAG: aldo/keto reductase, partial [Chloroflexi bacterium]|nr:aldo/keto reductase [Chloroflexota bacterium]
VRALDDMVSAGKVLYIGISDTPAWVVAQGNTLADLRGWSRFVGVQAPYNLLERELEGDMLPMAHAFDMAAVTWGSLSSGKLTGKHSGHAAGETKRHWWSSVPERETAIIGEVVKIAGEIEHTPSQVAINWVRQQQHRTVIIPLLGARTAEQITDNLGCLDFTLSDEHLTRLNEISEMNLGFPHNFLASDGARRLVYGSTIDRLDNHRGEGR